MGDLQIALDKITANIKILTEMRQTQSLSKEEERTIDTLIANANLAFISASRYSNSMQTGYSAVAASAADSADTLSQLNEVLANIQLNQEEVIAKINIEKSTKMKQIQFNAYYAQMNNYNVNIMKILVVSSILMMINIFLYTKKYITDDIYTIITMIIISITIIIISTMIYSEFQRSNYNFTTFKWVKPS